MTRVGGAEGMLVIWRDAKREFHYDATLGNVCRSALWRLFQSNTGRKKQGFHNSPHPLAPCQRKTHTLKMTQDGKLSSESFWTGTSAVSNFPFSWAVQLPSFQITHSTSFFFLKSISSLPFFLPCFCWPHQEAGGASELLQAPPNSSERLRAVGSSELLGSGVERIPAVRMSEHVLWHAAWWGKQTRLLDGRWCGPPPAPHIQISLLFSIFTGCRFARCCVVLCKDDIGTPLMSKEQMRGCEGKLKLKPRSSTHAHTHAHTHTHTRHASLWMQ